MDNIKNGLELDISQNYVEAILQYEQEIKDGTKIVDTYINLAFLYWMCATQFSWADEYKIPNSIRVKSVKRYTELINEAKNKFTNYGELFFWEKYFLHRLIFDEFSLNDALVVLSKYNFENNLTPYFFLYLFDNLKYQEQRKQLLELTSQITTAKNLYIKSLIES